MQQCLNAPTGKNDFRSFTPREWKHDDSPAFVSVQTQLTFTTAAYSVECPLLIHAYTRM